MRLSLLFIAALAVRAQPAPELAQILQRLERLEQENRSLREELRDLREQVHSNAAAAEKVEIHEQRLADQAQTKVEASRHFPIRITGMALFNAFLNSKQSGEADYPTYARPTYKRHAGATFRQTVLGLDYRGPETFWGAKVGGSLFLDFYGDSGEILNQGLRLRTASIDLEWKTRSLMAGLEKPIFNPREPNSLAQVGISPLTGAGNLWLWIPQVRFEQRIALAGEHTGLRAQFGVVGTREAVTYNAPAPPYEIAATRPGLEGRFELFHGRFEVAPGFHYSVSHVQQTSVPSRVFSLDWRAGLAESLDWSGALFKGSNVGHLGTGGLGRSFNVYGQYVSPIHSMGGWTQLSWRPFPRANFNFFTGQHDDRDRDLYYGRIAKNLAYGANLIYRLAPNVLLGLEAAQVRSRYIGQPTRRNNHYDLALAYLF